MASQLKALALCLVLCATFLTIKAADPTPTLVADKDYLQSGEVVTFECTDFTYDVKTTGVSFIFDKTTVYDSKTKKIEGKGITVTNATQITVNGTEWGKEIVAPTCKLNTVSSKPLKTLPFIAPLTLFVAPKDFKSGTAFTATCNVDVHPTGFDYNVRFYQTKDKNDKNFAKWAKNNKSEWEFSKPVELPGATVAAGKANETTGFSAVVTPKNNDATGDYNCYVYFAGNKNAEAYVGSDKWVAKGNSAAVLPSILLLTITGLFALLR